jgi:hypothetical protein
MRDWQGIWFVFAGYALILGIIFPFVFRYKHERRVIREAEAELAISEAEFRP